MRVGFHPAKTKVLRGILTHCRADWTRTEGYFYGLGTLGVTASNK